MRSIALACIKYGFKSQMAYRSAFIVGAVAQGIGYVAQFMVLWLLARRFGALGGWNWPELVLLSAFHVLGYALGAAFTHNQMRDVDVLLRSGEFDLVMLKPISPWAYLALRGVNTAYLSHIVTSSCFLIYAFSTVQVDWTWWRVLYMLAALVSAAGIHAGLMSMIGAASVRTMGASQLYTLYVGFWEVLRYPLNIFPGFLQGIMFTIVPMGFVNYLPCALLLGKPLSPPLVAAAWCAPLIGPLVLLLAGWCWARCVRHYQSGGG